MGEFDTGIRNADAERTVKQLSTEFGDVNARETYFGGQAVQDPDGNDYQRPEWGTTGGEWRKYHALNFNHFMGHGTIEVRGFRPQRSADDYIMMLELLQSRVCH